MASRKDKIFSVLEEKDGLTDREITNIVFGVQTSQQSVSEECRYQAQLGNITRIKENGLLRNYLKKNVYENEKNKIRNEYQPLSEDYLKFSLQKQLSEDGWNVEVAYGRKQGADVIAIKDSKRWIVEVKGIGLHSQARNNYFLAILGETLQRMNDPESKYSIALPDIKQFRNLWERFPLVAKERTMISALFISQEEKIEEVY